ncbi:hypothetical protein [Enterobacter roggenkampii]|uniref:hypothetical protein n=1 Tax=Enterobacter roggenkampii TaxID=1812935 RepID=UPI00388E7F06
MNKMILALILVFGVVTAATGNASEINVNSEIEYIHSAPATERIGLLCEVQYQMNVQGATLAQRELSGESYDDPVQRYFYSNAKILMVSKEKADALVEKLKSKPSITLQILSDFRSSAVRASQVFSNACKSEPGKFFINSDVFEEYLTQPSNKNDRGISDNHQNPG